MECCEVFIHLLGPMLLWSLAFGGCIGCLAAAMDMWLQCWMTSCSIGYWDDFLESQRLQAPPRPIQFICVLFNWSGVCRTIATVAMTQSYIGIALAHSLLPPPDSRFLVFCTDCLNSARGACP